MRYRYRGWNGAAADPVADLRAVLDGLPPRITRVLLIGHSLGGRAVIAAGNHPLVEGVLAHAPWLPGGEPLVLLHGPVVGRWSHRSAADARGVRFAVARIERMPAHEITRAQERRVQSIVIPVAAGTA